MAIVSQTVSVDRLRDLLDYNPENGVFLWRQKPAKNVRAGAEAGSVKTTGGKNAYRYIRIDGVGLPAVRIAWAIYHGEWTPARLTFKDKNSLNLRIDNIVEQNCLSNTYDKSDPEQRKAYLKEHRETYKVDWKNSHLRNAFGIELSDYAVMIAAQNNKCAICDQPETEMRNGKIKSLAVDHHHDTGMIRGLLCVRCNTGIGKLGDYPAILRAAADYIERHAERTENVVFIKGKGSS